MKIHLGCGKTLLDGFVNIDNSPSALLSRFPVPLLVLFNRSGLINKDQFSFARTLKDKKEGFLRSNCLSLPFKNESVDLCYSSHLIGWNYLSLSQLHALLSEIYRVLKPGAGLRLSCLDFNLLVQDYLQHKDTILFTQRMPLGLREFSFRDKLVLLFRSSWQTGVILNKETIDVLLSEHGFTRIQFPAPGLTTLPAGLVGDIDLAERADESLYVECIRP